MRSPRPAIVALSISVLLAACVGGAPTGDPATVVRQALQLVEQGQFDDIAALACEERRDEIAGDFGLGQALPEGLPPGFDAQAFAAAFTIKTDDLEVSETSRTGDAATVHVKGTMTVTVDKQRLADLIGDSGLPVDEAILGPIIDGIGEQLADGIPLDQDVDVIDEDGAWKIC